MQVRICVTLKHHTVDTESFVSCVKSQLFMRESSCTHAQRPAPRLCGSELEPLLADLAVFQNSGEVETGPCPLVSGCCLPSSCCQLLLSPGGCWDRQRPLLNVYMMFSVTDLEVGQIVTLSVLKGNHSSKF